MMDKEKVMTNSVNKNIITYLNEAKYRKELEFINDVSLIKYSDKDLKTHPDIVELLWNDCSKQLPVKCQMVLFATPVLINPISGIIFGIAEGTNPPLLRLPKNRIPFIITKGGTTKLSNLDGVYADAEDLGNDWVYCFSYIKNIDKYGLEAYEYSRDSIN